MTHLKHYFLISKFFDLLYFNYVLILFFSFQGKVVYDNKLPGVFIEAIDCDDFGGNCQCGFFSVSRAILDGMNGSPPNNMTTGCKTFALLPKDRKDVKIQ